MAVQQGKGFLGHAYAIKTAGQTSPGPVLWVSGAATYSFPVAEISPTNPDNYSYPSVVNAQGALSVKVQGKATPAITFSGIPVKSSWFVPTLLNDFIGGSTSYLDTNNNTSEYTFGVNNGSSTRGYTLGKCSRVRLYQTAAGGPILMDMDWLFTKGDQSSPGANAPTADAGTLADITYTSFAAGSGGQAVDAVYAWDLTLMRPQGYQMECDGTLYTDTIQSGMLGGTFTYTTSDLNATPLTSQTNLVIATSTSVTMVIKVNRDSLQQSVGPRLGTRTYSYTLINSAAGYPITIS